MINDAGLVLEGGGMRGVYTSGVLDFFMEKELYFLYVIGVSAGACNAASYISRQIGRNRKVTIGFIRDPRYLSWRNLLRERSLFGMDFIFNKIPNRLEPFDFAAFARSPQRFVVGTTDCLTGEPHYIDKDAGHSMLDVIRASSSLPFVSPTVQLDGRTLLDGGIADPIPVQRAMADGFLRNVVVLTRDKHYRKKPFKFRWLARSVYPQFTGLQQALVRRYAIYNETLERIDRLEAVGQLFVIRPEKPLPVGRMEKDAEKLEAVYELGYRDAKEKYGKLMNWLSAKEHASEVRDGCSSSAT